MSKLSEVFAQIDKASAKLDTLSAQIIDAIRDAKAHTLDAFNELAGQAYEDNGWGRGGRPVEGSQEKSAPPTIRNYVATIRRAYKIGLKVHGFKTLRELRNAVRAAKQQKPDENDKPSELIGVSIKGSNQITGALFHDLVVIWEHLSEDDRTAMDSILNRARNRFQKKTPLRLVS